MTAESIYTNSDNFTAFPEPDDVFASDVEKSVMLPLAKYRPEGFNEEILLATLFADSEGLVGRGDLNEFIGGEWYSYSRVDGKWKLDCSPEDLCLYVEMKEETQEEYLKQKLQFKEFGYVPNPNCVELPYPDNAHILFTPRNKIHRFSNWFTGIRDAIHWELLDECDEYGNQYGSCFDSKGNAYQYIGHAYSGAYTYHLNADLHFLYCKATDRVLVAMEFN
ncbi:hypothetical protein HCH_04559 [Hahella chejuensis KCTC 2396]|uniref:Uncharacterized protein n=1 Tax=Hahella chejuensis (strain KCTC 2396) TaxID=349521 RepID=Q2SDL5_HAHCH|nr:hypothetical protein [Hahella chejuensis]ABC31259.1 hypothetical protein HCH_04559 [Hahella chejuensis KCTC 2396]